jgi:histidine ammonia-lyase
MSSAVLLTGTTLDTLAVERVADGATIELDPASLRRVAENRAALDEAIARGDAIYGVTTGLGALVREQITLDQTVAAQRDVLRSHAAGVGEPLPRGAVRAAMAVRLNSLLRGYSGIRPLVLERIAAILNSGFLPIVPRTGSLGASGDLAPSAHAFLPLIGEGTLAAADGAALPAAAGLSAAGIEPLELAPKEALALVNGTHFMAAIGALACGRAQRLLATADGVASLSLEALRGEGAAFDARVHALRPLAGQRETARIVSALVAGSERIGTRELGIQDAYSLRCVPQVHGAAREAVDFARRLVEVDLNAVTDNPIVLEGSEVVSAGNFHGQSLALALDTLRLGLADLASISERRTFRLLSPSLNHGLPAFLTPEAGRWSGYMVAQYTAAALVGELRVLAQPVSVDTVPTSDSQEDHVSMGMTAALHSLEALGRAETVVAIEALCAAQAIDLVPGRPGAGAARLYGLVRERVEPLIADRPPADDIEAVRRLVAEGELAVAGREATA